jgi:hypothetical protein
MRQLVHLARKFAGERTPRTARCRCRSTRYQIGDSLSLHQVEFASMERSFGELPGASHSSTKRERRLNQEIQYDRATMALKFHDIVPGKRPRPCVTQDDSLIDRLARSVSKRAQGCHAGSYDSAADCFQNWYGKRSGNAYDTDPAATDRRRDRDNVVAIESVSRLLLLRHLQSDA